MKLTLDTCTYGNREGYYIICHKAIGKKHLYARKPIIRFSKKGVAIAVMELQEISDQIVVFDASHIERPSPACYRKCSGSIKIYDWRRG